MQHLFELGDISHELWLVRDGASYALLHEGRQVAVDLVSGQGGRATIRVDGVTMEAVIAVDGDDVFVHIDGQSHHVRFIEPIARHGRQHSAAAEDVANAPMPGVVVQISVTAGQQVALGETLLVIESMKLETAIRAWRDGTVAAVHVEMGRTFERATPLVSLTPEGD